MPKLREILKLWKTIFANKLYIVVLLAVAFLFYLLNGIMLNIRNTANVYDALGFTGSLKFLALTSTQFINYVSAFSAVTIILLSLLIGFFVALLAYRFQIIKQENVSKQSFIGSLGVLLGAAAPACVGCGIGLLSVLGLGAALAALPFRGSEIIVVAIAMLSFSIISLSGKIYKPVCELNLMQVKEMKGGNK